MKVSIVLFRNDFRLTDQEALFKASQESDDIIPLYIHDEGQRDNPGAASLAYLHHCLTEFAKELDETYGIKLVIRKGRILDELHKVLTETAASAIYFGSCLDGLYSSSDLQILNLSCDVVELCNTRYMTESHELVTLKGDCFKVFTPYYKSFLNKVSPRLVYPKPESLGSYREPLQTLSVDDLRLLPKINWDKGFYDFPVGEQGAQVLWKHFLATEISFYTKERNFPAKNGVSRLSTALHFGEISPIQMYHQSREAKDQGEGLAFQRQLVWREFSLYCLENYPQMQTEEYNKKFTNFPWENDPDKIETWKKGETGFPIVDAAMKELWQTGIMHNRCRMIVASFLVKNLLVDWRIGMKYFEETLIDADIPNNTFSWQWAAGCGLDAAPYFRIFNPWLQSAKFDAKGEYIKKYLPQLQDVSPKNLHDPERISVAWIYGYPSSIVRHDLSRLKALELYKAL